MLKATMAYIEPSPQLTPRESIEMEFAERKFDKEAAYNVEIAKLNLEEARLEAKWSALLKVPLTIVKLPIYALFGIGYICSVLTNQEPSENFWKFLK